MDKQLSDLQLTLSTLSLKRNLKHLRYINFTKKEKTILVSHKIPTKGVSFESLYQRISFHFITWHFNYISNFRTEQVKSVNLNSESDESQISS